MDPFTGGIVCARCVVEHFNHDPKDPHILHGPSCDPVKNEPAWTIIDGQALCVNHALVHVVRNAEPA